jgi:hypothetical protein
MANVNLTANQAYNIAKKPRRLHVVVNKALTGTVPIVDNGVTIATITNPAVGDQYNYGPCLGAVVITPSASCDITVWTE